MIIALHYHSFFSVYAVFLLYDSPPSRTVSCRHDGPCSWTLSADGTERGMQPLSQTSNRYTINGCELTLTWNENVTGEDGGLYRCQYSSGGLTAELCVSVYGKSKVLGSDFANVIKLMYLFS